MSYQPYVVENVSIPSDLELDHYKPYLCEFYFWFLKEVQKVSHPSPQPDIPTAQLYLLIQRHGSQVGMPWPPPTTQTTFRAGFVWPPYVSPSPTTIRLPTLQAAKQKRKIAGNKKALGWLQQNGATSGLPEFASAANGFNAASAAAMSLDEVVPTVSTFYYLHSCGV